MITKTTIKLLVRKIISLKDMPKSGYGSLFIDYDSHTGYEIRLITEDSVSTPFQTSRLKPKEMYDRLCTEIAKIKREQEIIKNFQKNLAMETSTYSDEQMLAFLSMSRFFG